MFNSKHIEFPLFICIIVLLLVTLPFVIATCSGGDNYIFNGFLLNPLDGNSYIAKMYQGWEGSWRFFLPYTSEPGEGAYLFLFYLGLGHLARILNTPLLVVYHFARLMGCIVLLMTLWWFYDGISPSC